MRSVVRDHHERWDGSGYPRGLVGERIGEFPRIAAVADVYDAITSQRPYARGRAAARRRAGHRRAAPGTAFDPAVVKVFRRVVMPYPVGTEVTLPDGRIGVVADVDTARPDEPVVRVDGADVRVDMRVAAA